MKRYLYGLGIVALAVSAFVGCSDTGGDEAEADDLRGTDGQLGSLSVELQVDGKAVSSGSRVWYSPPYGEHTSRIVRELQKNRPQGEGDSWWVDTSGTLWHACIWYGPAGEGEREHWCDLLVWVGCGEGPCDYGLRVHTRGSVGVLTQASSWESDPHSWYSGTFRWGDEFVPAMEFMDAYGSFHDARVFQGPSLEISVNDGKVSARGWVRRAKEDFGIIVEDGRKVGDGIPLPD